MRRVGDQSDDLMLVLVPAIDREVTLTHAAVPQRLPVPVGVLNEAAEPSVWCFVEKERLRKAIALAGRHACSG
jgi:hypothetical protein